MREVKTGNGNAFVIVFNRYHRLVLTTALRILHDTGEAEDVAQGVFFEIYRKADQFDPTRGTLVKWILQYAYHRSINRKNYLTIRNFYEDVGTPPHSEEGWTTLVAQPAQDSARLAKEALACLNEKQRYIVELVFFAGLSLREIAKQAEQTYHSVRHHYYRALKCMRDYLTAVPDKEAASVRSSTEDLRLLEQYLIECGVLLPQAEGDA